jgi:hypothetical protein
MTIVVNTAVLTSTLRQLRDRYVDQSFKAVPLYAAMERAGNIKKEDGGSYVEHPISLLEHSIITQISNGNERINNNTRDIEDSCTFDYCDFIMPVVMKGREMRSNKGPRKVIDIAENRLKNVIAMGKREWCKQVVRGDATYLTDLNTLNGEGINGGAAQNTNGFLELHAFETGGQSNSVGGVSKATYASNNWNNHVADVNNNFSSNGEAQMGALVADIQPYLEEGAIDIILASSASYKLYRQTLNTREQYQSLDARDSMVGKLGLMYNGAMMYIEPNLGFTCADGSTKFSMYFLTSSSFCAYFDKDAMFAVGEMKETENYDKWQAKVITRTQLATDKLAVHGVLLNAEQ